MQLAPPLPQVVTALLSLLSSGGSRPLGCTALAALASAVEWFCKTAEARPQMGEVLERVRIAVSPHLCAPGRLAEASELGARYLDLLYRAALFCSPALFGSPQVLLPPPYARPPPLPAPPLTRRRMHMPHAMLHAMQVLHEALQLLVPCLRQPQRELLRSACSLLARLASAAEAQQLAPHLDSLAEPLLGALLSAVATHAPEGLPARVDDALRTLLQCCGGRAREWLARAVLAEKCGPLVGTEAKQQLVQARAIVSMPIGNISIGRCTATATVSTAIVSTAMQQLAARPALLHAPCPTPPCPTLHPLTLHPLAVQAALELLDDNRSFRALVCDFQMLCRATAPPPREAMQTTYFII